MPQLTVCLERLRSGHGGIVSILGEAGLGKSRLVTEVRRTSAGQAVLWLEGRALSFGQTLSYWPFLEILRDWLGITEEDSEADAQGKLERQVCVLFPADPVDILPYVATLLRLPVPLACEHRVKYLDGQAMGRQVFRSIRGLFERLARQRPVVLVFEDLHWTDQSSAELIEHLFPLVETVPLLLWGIGRPEQESPAMRLRDLARTRYERRYTEVALVPLAPTVSAVLMDNLLAARHVPVRLKDLILHKTEGNPFFVEEVLHALVATGVLAWDERAAQWRVTREIDQVTIPDTIQDVIMARIDRLDEEVKQLLKIASVIGRSFFYRVLRSIAEAARELDQDLDRLQQLELIREKRRTPELEYFFTHALVQEATYESVLVERRRQLHRQVGQCLERLFADGLEPFYGVLAYHYARAEDWQKAQEYLFRVGDQSEQVAADAEALAHYREAMSAYERAFGDRWDPVQRANLDRKIGEALFRQGAHEQAYEHLARAVASLTAPYPRSRWGIRLAIVREVVRQLGHRLLPGLCLPKRGEEADPVGDELLRLQTMMGWIDYFTNQERFLLVLLTALNLSERRRHAVALTLQYMGAGLVCDVIPAFALAAYYHRRAVAHAEETAHPVAVGHAYLGMALHEDALGQWRRALDHYRTAAAAFREAGHVRGWGQATVQIGWSYALRGDFPRAIDCAQEVMRLGQDASDRPIWAWGLIVRGWIKRCTGAMDEAIGDLEAAIDLSKRIPDYGGLARANGLLGGCYLRQGRVDDALTVLKEADVIISERGLRGREVAFAPLFLAEALLRAADVAEGAARTGLLHSATRACRDAMRQGKRVRPYFPMAARVRGMWEWRVGKPGAAERSWRSSIAVAEALEAPYLIVLTVMESGRCLGRPAELTRAAGIAAGIGASLERAEARQLLGQGTAG
jgi:tetratricopeptide (TPR) repeat protein